MATRDDPELERWVDDRMAMLGPGPMRPADADRGLALLKARLAVGEERRSRSLWLVAAAVAGLGVVALTVEALRQGNRLEVADTIESAREPAGAMPSVNGAGSGVSLEALDRASRPALIPVAQRALAPDFRLPDMDGGHTVRADYAGQVLLLNFWATWCRPCRTEMPWFSEFRDVFANRGLEVLGVSIDESGWDVVRPFLEDNPVTYRIALADSLERMAPFEEISLLPTTWIIDRQGRIAAKHLGLVERRTFEAEIRLSLDEGGE